MQFLRKRLISSQLGHAVFTDWNATFVACAFAECIPELEKLHSETPPKLLFLRVWLLVSLIELMGLYNIRHHWLQVFSNSLWFRWDLQISTEHALLPFTLSGAEGLLHWARTLHFCMFIISSFYQNKSKSPKLSPACQICTVTLWSDRCSMHHFSPKHARRYKWGSRHVRGNFV